MPSVFPLRLKFKTKAETAEDAEDFAEGRRERRKLSHYRLESMLEIDYQPIRIGKLGNSEGFASADTGDEIIGSFE